MSLAGAFILAGWLAGGELTGDPLASYRGVPVVAVEVDAPDEIDAKELRALIDIQPGYLLATQDLATALKRIYALGRFADVGVTAERISGSVSLRFYVRPIRRLARLAIEGLESADPAALRRALGLEIGAELDKRTAPTLARRALEHLRRAGFPAARVSVTQASDAEATQVELRLEVSEGEPRRIAELQVVGDPRLERRLLQRLLPLAPGDVADLTRIDAALAELERLLRRHGFLTARVEPVQLTEVGDGLRVTIPVFAGDRVIIAVAGNRRLSRADLWSLWPGGKAALQPGDLDLFSHRIREAYRRLGHQNVKVTRRTAVDPGRREQHHTLTVEEGPVFRLTELTFVGATAFAPEVLAAQVRSYLERSLEPAALFERLRAADRCLLAPRGLAEPRRPRAGCERPAPPAGERWLPELVERSLEEIRGAYRDRGYLLARVGPAQESVVDAEVRLNVPVDEGPQTRIASLAFRGNQAFTAGELLATVEGTAASQFGGVPQLPGAPYSANGVEEARIALLRQYRNVGYLYANAFADVAVSDDHTRAEVTFRFEEGPQVHIERILVRGNRFTRESVIRNRLSLKPGDYYRLEQVLADQRALAALGVFSSVRVKLIDEEKPAELKDLVAAVTERPRQPVELGVGLSSEYGPRARVSYAHINVLGTASTFTSSLRVNRKVFFNLYGIHQDSMRERYEEFDLLAQVEREVRLGLQSPRWTELLGDPAARVDLIHERKNAISYSLDSISAIFGVDLMPTSWLTVGLEPQISLTNLQCTTNVDIPGEDFCSDTTQNRRRIDRGLRRTFTIGPSFTVDQRDSPFNPSRGFFAGAKALYAFGRSQPDPSAALEEPFSFAKVEGSLSSYWPVGALVFAASARGGWIRLLDGKVPIDERFFLGGRGTLRGFPEGGTLIPEDACVIRTDLGQTAPVGCETIPRTATDPPLTGGGELFVLFKGEARLPLPWSDSLSLGLFVDAGNLWIRVPSEEELALRVGTGIGVRYSTPIGPLAFDLGFNTDPRRRNGEPITPRLHFSIGVF